MRIDPNPYRWDQINLNLFYGRHELAAEILTDLRENHSNAVVGGRKIGKTTLLRKIERELAAAITSVPAGSLTLPVYVDILKLPRPLTPRAVYVDIVRQVEQSLKNHGLLKNAHRSQVSLFEELPREEIRVFAQILTDLVERMGGRIFLRLAILFDEIEPIAKSDWAEGFFSNWRHLLSNEPDLSQHISVVLSGAKEMSVIARDVSSPLANILSWRELSLFSRQETERLVHEPTGGHLSASIARAIFNLTGGHPFLIQYLMHHVCRYDTVEAKWRLEEARQKFLADQSFQFRNWFDKFSDDDRRVYAHLLSKRYGVPKREIVHLVGDVAANNSLAVLCNTGVIIRLSHREQYKIAGAMFRDWFRGRGGYHVERSGCDENIYESLGQLDADIARKYVSAWAVYTVDVPNYSGAVSEMRDVVTLVLHRLAPDKAVTLEADYVPERDEKGEPMKRPTRRQRAKFIMQQKGARNSGGILKDMNLFDTLNEQLANVVSEGYSHASARTHTVATREQAWRCLKQLDSILAQLL